MPESTQINMLSYEMNVTHTPRGHHFLNLPYQVSGSRASNLTEDSEVALMDATQDVVMTVSKTPGVHGRGMGVTFPLF